MSIKLKDFAKKFEQKMDDALDKALSKAVLEEAKDAIVNDIRKRVTLGFGVNKTGGGRVRLKKLSDSYVTARRRYLDLGKNAKPKKSNLHQTGQMIEEDLGGIVIEAGDKRNIIIGMNTDRSARVAAFVEKERPFLKLSGPEIKRIIKFFRFQITEIFKKSLKSLD